jgi:hypothetical protein
MKINSKEKILTVARKKKKKRHTTNREKMTQVIISEFSDLGGQKIELHL